MISRLFKKLNYLFFFIAGSFVEFLNYNLSKFIINHYGGHYNCNNYKSQNLDNKTGNLGYGLIHYSLIRNIRPKRVLCIGSTFGYIPFICALACRNNRKGIVDFVDASYDIKDPKDKGRHNFGEGFWRNCKKSKHFFLFKTYKYLNLYVMTSNEFANKYPNRKYDYIYIDGDHTYDGVKLDYQLYWSKLNNHGFMSFHDTDNKGHYKDMYFNVTKLWKKLVNENIYKIHFRNPKSGLGIIQKYDK